MNDSLATIRERFYTLLYYQLQAQMPRPGGIHKYSTGRMLKGFTGGRKGEEWWLEMSQGVSYSKNAMGYREDGSKRSPRGPLERINFETIEKCINEVSKIVSSQDLGGVYVNGNKIY